MRTVKLSVEKGVPIGHLPTKAALLKKQSFPFLLHTLLLPVKSLLANTLFVCSSTPLFFSNTPSIPSRPGH
ncbi:hypothetical protein QNI22_15420 [Cytophagaceae bacterium BD1B2-1]|uniref:Uncharacterized protein n=1 Tax=Xanthocytophaga agilis TaxID=3048010 RepID=A0AAE3R2P5_9BACT|nr:hypothetical protein [Xanthocytophaga agilis]